MSFSHTIFNKQKSEFVKATKKILKKEISSNPIKLIEYENEIIELHDTITKYIEPHFVNFSKEFKEYYRNELVYVRDKTLKCFGALKSKKKISNNLTQLLRQSDTITDDSGDDSSHQVSEFTLKCLKTKIFQIIAQ